MPVCAGQLQNQLLTNGLCLMLQGCKKDDRATVFEMVESQWAATQHYNYKYHWPQMMHVLLALWPSKQLLQT